MELALLLLFGALALLFVIAVRGILLALRAQAGPVGVVAWFAFKLIAPYLYQLVWVADRMALKALSDFNLILDGADKAKIASDLYDMLPAVPVVALAKLLIPREQFETLVQQAYDRAHVFIDQNEAYLHDQVLALGKQIESDVGVSVTAGNTAAPSKADG